MKHPIAPLPCEERERLEKAYQEALQAKYRLEDQVERELVSKDRNQAKRAKKQCAAALRHAIHILNELLKHERKHECT